MAQVVEELISKVSVQGDAAYVRSFKQMQAASNALGRTAVNVGSNIVRSLLNPINLLIGTVAAGGLLGAVGASVELATEFDSLKRGMAAVSPEISDINDELKRLRDIAKLPGLGFMEVIQGFTNLKAAGLDIRTAERSLMAFGNALATVGKGKESLDFVNLAITQMANKSTGFGQEIRQLTEHLPQLRQALMAIFGTAESESIANMGFTGIQVVEKLIGYFETLPRVTGGAKNSFENFFDTVKRGAIAFGTALLPAITKVMDTLSKAMERIVDSGLITKIVDGFTKMFDADAFSSSLVRGLAWVLATLKNMPTALQKLGITFEATFKGAWEILKGIGVALAVIGGVQIITGLVNVVKVFIAFYGVVRAAAAATLAMAGAEAILTKNVAAAVAVTATATAMTLGIYMAAQAARAMMEKMNSLPGQLGQIFDFDAIKQDFDNIMGGVSGPGQIPNPSDAVGGVSGPTGGGYMAQIARNTALTAEGVNGLKVDFRRIIIGGGALGRSGVTPVEVREEVLRMRRQRVI